LKAFDLQCEEKQRIVHRFRFKVEHDVAVHATGAADKELAIVFRVEIDEGTAFKKTGFQAKSTGESRFFINREQALNRTVFQCGIGQYSQLSGHTDAVVGPKGGTVGLEPFTINDGLDGICLEIVDSIGVLFADHIHMGLQNNGRRCLFVRAGRLADEHVAHLVLTTFQPMGGRKIE